MQVDSITENSCAAMASVTNVCIATPPAKWSITPTDEANSRMFVPERLFEECALNAFEKTSLEDVDAHLVFSDRFIRQIREGVVNRRDFRQ